MKPGTDGQPLRVAVVGSGPAGFYTVQALFASKDLHVEVDLFDRLPTPFGLVRHGVAPDHPKIKSVTAVYHKLAGDPRCRFFGGVEFGKQITLEQLLAHYHQVVMATGSETDRRLGIPGEDLEGSHPATEFVAWYNGHPDYSHLKFDLDCERAIVVGVGNVAVDVARILCRTPEELATTDIADYAALALKRSSIREVILMGRRGPVQAKFTNPEIKELGELAGASITTLPREVEIDEASRAALEGDRAGTRRLDILQSYADRKEADKPRRLILRFLVSPVEIEGSAAGRVEAVRIVRNELEQTADGRIRAKSTDDFETLRAGLIFRSVGYHGVALPDLPFREDWGVVPNEKGRVIDPEAGAPLCGVYVSGWIKRGPSGVIGTNKPDAAETVACMKEDLAAGNVSRPAHPEPAAIPQLLERQGVRYVTYDDWLRIDAAEVARGKAEGRPRVKLTRREEFAELLKSRA